MKTKHHIIKGLAKLGVTFDEDTLNKYSNVIEFKTGNSLNALEIIALTKYFGTMNVTIDHYSYSSGCQTCGYGAEEGHEITITGATKNHEWS